MSASYSTVVVAVQTPEMSDCEAETSLDELEQLLRGLGIEVHARVVQKRPNRTSPNYVGEGKLRELAAFTGGPGEWIRVPQPDRGPAEHAGAVALVVADDE